MQGLRIFSSLPRRVLRDHGDDLGGRVTLAVSEAGARHERVARGITSQAERFSYDVISVAPHQHDIATLHQFLPLRLLAHQQQGNAERGAFLLEAAGVGDDERRGADGGDHIGIAKRCGEGDVRHAPQLAHNDIAHIGIGVEWERHFQHMVSGESFERRTYPMQRRAEIFAPVAGNEDGFGRRGFRQRGGDMQQRINTSVAGDVDLAAYALTHQVVRRTLGWREVERSKLPNGDAVILFREGALGVVRTQARLNMADGDVECGSGLRAGERGVSVALHEDEVGAVGAEPIGERGAEMIQRSARRRAEVVVGRNTERGNRGIKQRILLAGGDEREGERGVAARRQHQRCHLDRLGAGSDNEGDLALLHYRLPQTPFVLSLSKDCISLPTLRRKGQSFDKLRTNGDFYPPQISSFQSQPSGSPSITSTPAAMS